MPRVAPLVVEYQRSKGLRLVYTIEAHSSGSYVIRLGDKVLRTGHDPLVVIRMVRSSKERQEEAIRSAKGTIELLMGMQEE